MISRHLLLLRNQATVTRLFALAPGAVFALAAVIPIPATAAQFRLPTQCSAAAVCSPVGGGTITQFATSGRATYGVEGNTGFVRQQDDKAIVNFRDFNIGRDNTVRYVRVDENGRPVDGASFSTLNRIYQGSKSIIEGKIEVQPGQNGAIYLINQNGILFSGTSRIDVNTLVASALNIKDEDFLSVNGIFNASAKFDGKLFSTIQPAFEWQGSAGDFRETMIEVEPGAKLAAQLGGSILLLAPNIINRGSISTNEGQVVLAAGAKVYITAPDLGLEQASNQSQSARIDSPYRGLNGILVEVDPYVDPNNPSIRLGGKVLNQTLPDARDAMTGELIKNTGEIIAKKGNVTLVGMAINQEGRISATTSVTRKGSIRLLARQAATVEEVDIDLTNLSTGAVSSGKATNNQLSALETGTLTFGADSVTEVTPAPLEEGSIPTLADNQVFDPSTIQGIGKKIILEDRSRILAPGGHITLSAQAVGNLYQLPVDQANDSRIYQGVGSLISVAGASGATASVERYFTTAQLFATELRDNPLNRDNPVLRRQELQFDLRNLPDSSLADLSPFAGTISRSVVEKLAAGGTVTLRSEGDIVLRKGSEIDISGNSVAIQGGFGSTSRLVSNGVLFDIDKAKGDRIYQVLINDTYSVTDSKWGVTQNYSLLSNRRFYAGYTEGTDAGKLNLSAHAYVLDGDVTARVIVGENQRNTPPRRGELVVNAQRNTPGVRILNPILFNPLDAAFAFNTPLSDERLKETQISTKLLNGGLGKIAVYSNGKITLESNSSLVLPEFGELTLSGSQIEVNDSITAAAGKINLISKQTNVPLPIGENKIAVASGVTLSTAGRWVNDKLAGADLALPLRLDKRGNSLWDGGTVSLVAYDGISLGEAGVIDVSGSGYVNGDGKFTPGNAGTITLTTNKGKEALSSLGALVLPADLRSALRAQAPGKGGSLNLKVPALTIGAAARGVDGEFFLTQGFFSGNGFAKYDLEGRNSVVVADGVLAPTLASRIVDTSIVGQPTGSDISQFSRLEVRPLFERQAVDLTLQARNDTSQYADTSAAQRSGFLKVERGAQINLDPGGTVFLGSTSHQLEVQGQISAPAGKITLEINRLPPSLEIDLGYDATQAIWIGSSARLSAAGAFVAASPSNDGLLRGKVLDAGSIVINAGTGYVVAEAGAVLDVSAVAATLPITSRVSPFIQNTRIAGNAGLIEVKAREGGLLDAELRGNSAGALGGRLALTLDNGTGSTFISYPGGGNNDPARLFKVELTQNSLSVPSGLKPGDNIDTFAPGRLRFGIDRALQGGFEQLAFNAKNAVLFKGDVTIPAAQAVRALSINAPVIESDGGKVALAAAYVNLGNQSAVIERQVQVASGGNGKLEVSAQHVDLTGHFALQGFGSANIASDGDVRLLGVVTGPTRPEGSFALQGDLQVRARQVVAATLSQYALNVSNQATFSRHGAPSPVLSAGSDILVKAKSIVFEGAPGSGDVGGALKAPLGSITLAADNIRLGEGSVISVSGENQLIPFGRTASTGREYLYGNQSIDKPLQKQIALVGKDVEFKAGATLDVSGGGDLLAYEFIKGLGGSADVLSPSVSPNTYAILPSFQGNATPYDSQYLAELAAAKVAAPTFGQSVFLNAGSGLAAGYYTLLPARYALLPGAFLVTQSGNQDLPANRVIAQIPGGNIVSGNFAALNRDGTFTQTSRTAGFLVEPGALARTRSEYLLTLGSDFFSGKGGQAPGDAGRVVFNASQSLLLEGSLAAQRAAGFRGAEVDIAARKLALVSPGGAALAPEDADAVRLDVAALNALGAESYVIGGTRSLSDQGIDLNVLAEKVIVANAAQTTFAAPEIVLAATQQVLVKSGSSISATGLGTSRAGDINITNSDGNGALLRVANGPQADVIRKTVNGAEGDLTVEANAVLSASGAINLDATQETKLIGTLNLGQGAGLALASGSIGVGDVQGLSGLNFDQAEFGTLLARTNDLRLTSYSTVGFYGKVDGQALLAGNAAPDLRLRATGLAGFDGKKDANGERASAEVILSGNRVTLANPNGTVETPKSGDGKLTIMAQELRTGDGQFALTGFADVKLQADSQIVAVGKGGLNTAANLTLDAPRVTAELGADFKFKSTANTLPNTLKNTLTITSSAGQAAALARNVPNARLGFEGEQVNIGGLIDLPAGKIDITATNGDLNLNSGAVVRAAAREEFLFDAGHLQPGGNVTLTARNPDPDSQVKYNVNLKAGSLVDVSAVDADAGTLKVVAKQFDVQGDLKGASISGAENKIGSQGRFELEVEALANLGDLADKLKSTKNRDGSSTGGFEDSVRITVTGGDTALAAGKTLKAREIQIANDGGDISIAGTLDANHARGGSIALAAKDDVTLFSGAILQAEASDVGRQGGRVEISAKDGYLDLQSETSIKVAGGAGGIGGQVWLRTGTDGNTPRVRKVKDDKGNFSFNLKSSVSGANYRDAADNNYSATYLEVVLPKNTLNTSLSQNTFDQLAVSIDNSRIAALESSVTDFYNALEKPTSIFRVVPSLEIVNTGGNITLANNWNFGASRIATSPRTRTTALRFGTGEQKNEAGVLTLRAKGNVNINASLSDGFTDTTGSVGALVAPDTWLYDTSLVDSWSYRIVAGSNGKAAPLGVNESNANVNFAAGVSAGTAAGATGSALTGTAGRALTNQVVRTGSGFIDVTAGQDIVFGLGTGNVDQVAVLYTAGRNSKALDGFTLPPTNTALASTNRQQLPFYTTAGGNIRLTARGEIRGNFVQTLTATSSAQITSPIINQWLFRYYTAAQVNEQTSWWSRFDQFRQGVATLGGGDITVEAKKDIKNLWLSAPTNARLGGDKDQAANIDNLVVQGGGDILERAGGKISNGLIFVAQGQGKVDAGDSLETRVALQDASVQLSALNDVTVLDAFNPTARNQQNRNVTSGGVALSFNSYGDRSTNNINNIIHYDAGLRVLSRSGSVELSKSLNPGEGGAYPGLLSVRAPQGSIRIDDASAISLFPNAFGDLDLISGNDVFFSNQLTMSDEAVNSIPGITKPANTSDLVENFETNARQAIGHDPLLLHKKDTKAVRIYAGNDIGNDPDLSFNLSRHLVLAKPAVLRAGRDVNNLSVEFQNLTSADVSQVLAGRDVIYQGNSTTATTNTDAHISVSGPGRLEVVAGRNIDLDSSDGIVSVGNLANPALGDQGASLTVVTGLGAQEGDARQPDYAAFAATYLTSTKVNDPADKALKAYFNFLGARARREIKAEREFEFKTTLADSVLDSVYKPEIDQRQQKLIAAFERENQPAKTRIVFFNELREAGKELFDPKTKSAKRGTDAAAVLFPATVNGQAASYDGDLNLFFSQIKTERGGDIELLVPGGLLNVGLASAGDLAKTADKLGIVSVRDGDVSAYVRDDILVNQARIFTLGGSDILLWSDQANIDAGKGAKTASAVPPPRIVVRDGKVTFDVSGSVSGSGISTPITRNDVKKGNATLVAPNGEVNAGDAGITIGGDLLIAAPVVLGSDNIKVGGESAGVPVASTGVTGAGIGANPNEGSSATEQTKALLASTEQNQRLGESLANFRPSFISVEVVGFGASGQSNGLSP